MQKKMSKKTTTTLKPKSKSKHFGTATNLLVFAVILISLQLSSHFQKTHKPDVVESESTVEALSHQSRRAPVGPLGQGVFASVLFVGLLFLSNSVKLREMRARLFTLKVKQPAYGQKVLKLSQQAIDINVSPKVAWDCLREAANGLDIKATDTRRTAWILNDTNDAARTIKCSLEYIADPLGRKLSAIYPRLIRMETSIESYGSSTRLRTRYIFPTPMNLETVSQITTQTSEKLVDFILCADARAAEAKNEIKVDSNEFIFVHQG